MKEKAQGNAAPGLVGRENERAEHRRAMEHFDALVESYMSVIDDLALEGDELSVEQALRAHARKLSGCVSCCYSRAHPRLRDAEGSELDYTTLWFERICVLGLQPDECDLHLPFPAPQRQ